MRAIAVVARAPTLAARLAAARMGATLPVIPAAASSRAQPLRQRTSMPDLNRPPVTAAPAPISDSEGSLITTWWFARHPYLVAPAISAIAIAAMFVFPKTAAHASIVFCAWAVIPTFLYGGFLPGLIVTVLTCTAADYLFIPPTGSMWIADAVERFRFIDSVALLLTG